MNKQWLIRMGAAFVTALCLAGCAPEQADVLPVPLPESTPDEAIEQVFLNLEETDLGVGEQVQLSFSCKPEEIVPTVVNWLSSNANVASVDARGMVTALSPGVAIISASAGHQADSALVSVYERRIPATGIRLSRTSLALKQGQSFTVKASLVPDNTTENKTFAWSSSQEGVATVQDGVIKAVGVGDAVIRIRHHELKDSIKVSVGESVVYHDISAIWTMAAQPPRWVWDADKNLVGAQEDVYLTGCDSYYHYLAVVHADKFDSIEKAADDLTALMAAMEADGEDSATLFKRGESDTLAYTYPQAGNAVAYVFGLDKDFSLTGEYALARFKTRTPEPIPATGIVFCRDNAPVTELSLAEGEHLDGVTARFLPEYCTDNGQGIRLESSDEDLLTVSAKAGFCSLDGRFKGQANILASFNGLTASLPVTVTRPDDGWTDCSQAWTGQFGTVPLWGFDTFGFTLESCTSPNHILLMVPSTEIGESLVYPYFKKQVSKVEKSASDKASSVLPDSVALFGSSTSLSYYVFVFGIDEAGEAFDGHYAIFHYVPEK